MRLSREDAVLVRDALDVGLRADFYAAELSDSGSFAVSGEFLAQAEQIHAMESAFDAMAGLADVPGLRVADVLDAAGGDPFGRMEPFREMPLTQCYEQAMTGLASACALWGPSARLGMGFKDDPAMWEDTEAPSTREYLTAAGTPFMDEKYFMFRPDGDAAVTDGPTVYERIQEHPDVPDAVKSKIEGARDRILHDMFRGDFASAKEEISTGIAVNGSFGMSPFDYAPHMLRPGKGMEEASSGEPSMDLHL